MTGLFHQVWEPPFGTPCEASPVEIHATINDATLVFWYFGAGEWRRAVLAFHDLAAFRVTRDEEPETEAICLEAFNCLAASSDTVWLNALRAAWEEKFGWQGRWLPRQHYIICIENTGLYEFAAASFEVVESEPAR